MRRINLIFLGSLNFLLLPLFSASLFAQIECRTSWTSDGIFEGFDLLSTGDNTLEVLLLDNSFLELKQMNACNEVKTDSFFAIGTPNRFIQLTNESLVIVGSSPPSPAFITCFSIFTDTLLWTDYLENSNKINLKDLIQLADGNLLISGDSLVNDSVSYLILIKSSVNGKIFWRKHYANTFLQNKQVIKKEDKEIIIAGTNKYGPALSRIWKIDTGGNIISSKEFIGFNIADITAINSKRWIISANYHTNWLEGYKTRFLSTDSSGNIVASGDSILNENVFETIPVGNGLLCSLGGGLYRLDTNGHILNSTLVGIGLADNVATRFIESSDGGIDILTSNLSDGYNIYGFIELMKLSPQFVSSIDNPSTKIQFEVYPNPVHNQLIILLPFSAAYIAISDALGKTIRQQNVDIGNEAFVGLQDLANGIYFLSIKDKDGRFLASQKFIKQ